MAGKPSGRTGREAAGLEKFSTLRRTRGARFVRELAARYRRHDIPRQSAALSYYLLFALFPLLIFISSLLGLLQLDVESILNTLSTVMPRAAVELCGMYLDYVGQTANPTMLWFSLVFSVYFPMRAANCLMQGIRRAYGAEGGIHILIYYLRLLLYTAFLLLVVAVALVLTTVGQRLLTYFTQRLRLAPYWIELWHYMRFVVLAVFLFAALGLLYVLAQDRPQTAEGVVPGVLISLAAWMVLSMGFSFYVEHFASYSVIYGTLGAVMVLLIWLYFSSVTLLLGAELNAMLLHRRRERDVRNNGGRPSEEHRI